MDNLPQKMFNVRLNAVRGKTILVQRNQAYELDEVALKIWELCDGSHSVEDIASKLINEYAVNYDEALKDCKAYITELKDMQLLQ